MKTGSLRLRLFTIILAPLVMIACGLGVWRVTEARVTAEGVFDKSLVFTALAVSRDVALADGDAISPETEYLLSDASGGPVRYHVYAPDGVFVTGYATPPVPIGQGLPQGQAFAYFDAVYRGRDVRVLRLKYVTRIAGFSGPFTVTVWQDQAVRQKFVRTLALRAFALIAALIGTTGVVVWFGVNLGLKPLLDLEDAISRRSPDDLSPIQRAVPVEARGLVRRLNTLLGQITATIDAQAAFISDASHQLRNPIAGVRALGEAVLSAKTLPAAKSRAADLVAAARRAGDLAENLMTLERARAVAGPEQMETVELVALLRMVSGEFQTRPEAKGLEIQLRSAADTCPVTGDPTLLQEAVKNLLHNAALHGGTELTRIDLHLEVFPKRVSLTFSDDGRGVAPADFPKIRARFGQADQGEGSGLGLSIAEAIATRHGGYMTLNPVPKGFSVSLHFPKG